MATVTQGLSQYLINIPAHAVNFDVTGTCTFNGTQQPNVVQHVQSLKAVRVKINGKPFEA